MWGQVVGQNPPISGYVRVSHFEMSPWSAGAGGGAQPFHFVASYLFQASSVGGHVVRQGSSISGSSWRVICIIAGVCCVGAGGTIVFRLVVVLLFLGF